MLSVDGDPAASAMPHELTSTAEGMENISVATSGRNEELGTGDNHDREGRAEAQETASATISSLNSKRATKQKPLWRELLDKVSGDFYYHNRQTGETVWERPSDEDMLLMFVNGEVVKPPLP